MTTLDTHTIIKELITAGMAEKHAEVLVGRFVIKEELNTVEKEHSQLATKADIERLEAATRADISKLEATTKADIAKLEAATKADIGKLDFKIEKLDSKIEKIEDVMKFDRALLIGIFLMLLGCVIKTLIH